MSDVTFNMTEHMGMGPQLLVALVGFIIFVAVIAAITYISSVIEKKSVVLCRIFITFIVGTAITFTLAYCAPKVSKFPLLDTPIIYSNKSFTKIYELNIDDFNKKMKNEYDYKFELKSTSGEAYYNVTNLKNNKKAYHCYLEFEKVNNDASKVKLVDVTCGNSIMQDIMKNK